jgi:hypothetical protein
MNTSEEYYSKLYLLQNEVLKHLESIQSTFYLTGGTALSRVYLNHRYSDDLDLFLNFSPYFEKEISLIKEQLTSVYGDYFKIQIDQDYFKRFFVIKDNIELKLEFINDVPYRVGELQSDIIYYKIDSWQNILSNKISALSRKAEKDIIDILFLSYKYNFNWSEIIDDAKQKDNWVEDIKFSKYFDDFNYISNILFIREVDKAELIKDIKKMTVDIIKGSENSLKKRIKNKD